MSMSRERAKELKKNASQFPYWGSYRKFMTDDEWLEVQEHFMKADSGDITIAAVVDRIARGLDPRTGAKIEH